MEFIMQIIRILKSMMKKPKKPPPAESSIFQHDFRSSPPKNDDWNVLLLPQRRGAELSSYINTRENLTHSKEGLLFKVSPGDGVVRNDFLRKKERAEIGRYGYGQGKEGQVCEYSALLKIPEGTVSHGFLILSQSHVLVGVNDSVFPSGWTVNLSVSGPSELMLQFKDVPGWMNGTQGKISSRAFKAPFGKDIGLSVRVKWSTKNDGWVECRLNGDLVTERLKGPTMPTSDDMEWKFGIYRGHQVKRDDSLLVRAVKHEVL